MIRNEYIIIDKHGMHARPAAALLKLARQFRSEITISKEGRSMKPGSMLNILTLGLKYGDSIVVEFQGEDESSAADAFDQFFNEEMKNF
jgi:phosphocarrier protein HPr